VIGELPLRATLFVMDPDDERPPEFLLVQEWFKKWKGVVKEAHYSSGGWEHSWDVESPLIAMRELPKSLFCLSNWATYPQPLKGPVHKSWATHIDDGTDIAGNPKADA
jgi:hypothetical protein